MSLFGKRKNETNSSMAVTCIAKDNCCHRHTTMCDKCKNNIGEQRDKSYFEPKESDNIDNS